MLLLVFIPPREAAAPTAAPRGAWAGQAAPRDGRVFRNPQSILCGLIAGLMFIPTTIFDMVWGVRFLQEGHDVPYSMAVLRSAVGAVRLDHRLPAAGLALRPDRPAQAGDHRRRGRAARLPGLLILYGPPGCSRPSAWA